MIHLLTLATKSAFFFPLTSQSLVISSTSNFIMYVLSPSSSDGAQWKEVVIHSVADIGWPAYRGGRFSADLVALSE